MTAVPSGTVLLTCFEPFDGQTVNASAVVAGLVAAGWSGPEALVVETLPVSFRGARQRLRVLVAEHRPDLVVLLGEAGGRAAVGIERIALNVVDARIPDADGSAPVDVPVIAGAPLALAATLPVKACLAAAQATGTPVEVSTSAGTYVCNATSYALLHLLGGGAVRGGLVHVPRMPEQVPAGAPALPAEASARAVDAVLRAALRGEEIRRSAGTES